MSPEEVTRIFAHLRETCDPRGHDVLDALETVVQGHSLAEERLADIHDVIRAREVVGRLEDAEFDRVQRELTERAVSVILGDTHDHSKSSELRVVRGGGRCV